MKRLVSSAVPVVALAGNGVPTESEMRDAAGRLTRSLEDQRIEMGRKHGGTFSAVEWDQPESKEFIRIGPGRARVQPLEEGGFALRGMLIVKRDDA